MKLPVVDMHCDPLSYLNRTDDASANDTEAIGCNIPDLKRGNVKLQVMAIYTATEAGSTDLAYEQSLIFKKLNKDYAPEIGLLGNAENLNTLKESSQVHVVVAIENAAGLCEENGRFEDSIRNLDRIIGNAGRPLYIGLTHHTENRFGGGNTTNIGLKDDGKRLLDHLHQQKMAIDFAHTSDVLAYDILNHIDNNDLDIPILASHSNYRAVFDHPRNLPDDIAIEIIKRKGLIGVNFLRAFLNNDNADVIYQHIEHGLKLGGEKAVCFGADYFNTDHHPDQSRRPFYHPEHVNASKYPEIVDRLSTMIKKDVLAGIAYKNAFDFISRLMNFPA